MASSAWRSLAGELKRRRVFQVAAVYAVVAWATTEIVATVAPILHLPDWTPTLVVVLLLAGFPLSLVLAWAFDLTPEGVRRTRSASSGDTAALGASRWLAGAVGLGILIALVAVGAYVHLERPGEMVTRSVEGDLARSAVAVLPLENLSPDPDNAFFTAGIHEEILARLAQIGNLHVISRTSVEKYGHSDADIRTIGRELGAAYVGEGSVRRAANRVLVTFQLINARTDEHLWAESYERDLKAAEIFDIQRDIAQRIAVSLQARLSPSEQKKLVAIPTENLAAYDAYLRGNAYFNRGLGDPSVAAASEEYERAVALDSLFVLGWAALAKAESRVVFQETDPSPERAARARAAVETALRLDPADPAAQAADGWYRYWVLHDYPAALKAFGRALKGRPGDSDVLLGLGLTERRLCLWDEAFTHLRLSFDLDPLSNEKAIEVGLSYESAQQYGQAVDMLRRAVTLAPDQYRTYAHLAAASVARDGVLESAVRVLRDGGDRIGRAEFIRRMLSPQPTWFEQLWLLDAFPQELRELDPATLTGPQRIHWFGLQAEMARRKGRVSEARAFADSVLSAIDSARRTRLELPSQVSGDWGRSRGLALAYLGQEAPALRSLRLVGEPDPSDGRNLQEWVLRGAFGLLLLGHPDQAVERLRYALTIPGEVSASTLRADPLWRDLRGNPQFDRITRE
jgi:TolB-like protein